MLDRAIRRLKPRGRQIEKRMVWLRNGKPKLYARHDHRAGFIGQSPGQAVIEIKMVFIIELAQPPTAPVRE